MENQLNERQRLEQHLIEKAMKDDGFRKQLLEAPRETIGKEFGIILPDSIKINILEEGPQQFYLVLPTENPESSFEELTEEELKSVAGGGKKLYSTAPEYCNIWNVGA